MTATMTSLEPRLPVQCCGDWNFLTARATPNASVAAHKLEQGQKYIGCPPEEEEEEEEEEEGLQRRQSSPCRKSQDLLPLFWVKSTMTR